MGEDLWVPKESFEFAGFGQQVVCHMMPQAMTGRTLYIHMEHIDECRAEWPGIRYVVIEHDGVEHRYDVDELIELLKGIEPPGGQGRAEDRGG